MISIEELLKKTDTTTITELARKLGITTRIIYYWNNEHFNPSFKNVQNMVALSKGKLKFEDFKLDFRK